MEDEDRNVTRNGLYECDTQRK